MSKFQIILISIFVLFIIVGVVAFATYKGSSLSTSIPPITVWGTFPAETFNQYVAKINNTLPTPITVTYTEKKPSQFSRDFISALARGQGPDAILITADMILPHEDKLALIPYDALSQRTFTDTYITEANIYLVSNGILALPFTVDPMVMYWNRDMFDTAGIATYPKYWDDFLTLNKKLTIKDQNGNIRKSAIAMGEFTNITNARELLGTLLLQSGNPVTVQTEEGYAVSALKVAYSANPTPVLKFFTQFADPSNESYSWNRAMISSKSAFLAGTLATYFGFASELRDIKNKNPNLNFDVSLVPQPKSGGQKATYGKMYGFSLLRSSPNVSNAFRVISLLTSAQYLSDLSKTMYLPTVRRDVIAQASNDQYISIFNEAALVSRTWLDADPIESSQIFGSMVESITSGQKTAIEAVQDAGDRYDIILRQVMQ